MQITTHLVLVILPVQLVRLVTTPMLERLFVLLVQLDSIHQEVELDVLTATLIITRQVQPQPVQRVHLDKRQDGGLELVVTAVPELIPLDMPRGVLHVPLGLMPLGMG